MVERGGIGKGCIAAYGRVEILFMAIGAKRRRVERDQRSPAGLCVFHTLHRWMDGGNCIHAACHQALHLIIASVLIGVSIPCLPNGRIFLRITSIHAEKQITACRDFIQLSEQGWVLGGILRLPAIKKS